MLAVFFSFQLYRKWSYLGRYVVAIDTILYFI